MRKRLQRFEITSNIAEHPAALAWKRYSNGGTPTGIEALKERLRPDQKSAVYLLKGCGLDGTDVVAKHRSYYRSSGTVERAPGEILALLDRAEEPVAPRLLGTVPGPNDAWIFLEYVDGVRLDPDNIEHRRGAARLAARIHNLQPTKEELALLPELGERHYKRRLEYAIHRMQAFEAEHDGSCPPVVQRVRARLDNVRKSWPSLEQSFRDHPAGIVHGDFAPKNLVVRTSGGRPEVIAVDWDTVGYGYRYVDLANVDLDEYLAASGPGSNVESGQALADALRVGWLLRLIDRVAWTAVGLKGESFDRPIRHLQSYDRAFNDTAY